MSKNGCTIFVVCKQKLNSLVIFLSKFFLASCVYFIHIFCFVFRSFFISFFGAFGDGLGHNASGAHIQHAANVSSMEQKKTFAKRYLQFRFEEYAGSKTMKNPKQSRWVCINKPYLWMRWIAPTSQLENTFSDVYLARGFSLNGIIYLVRSVCLVFGWRLCFPFFLRLQLRSLDTCNSAFFAAAVVAVFSALFYSSIFTEFYF